MKKSIGPNTFLYPQPVLIIGTYDKNEKPNIMTVAWGGICCSKPPCIAISLRKATYTYSNIMDNKVFTVNIPSVDHVKEADYVGLVSGKNVDKFATAKLTPIKSEIINAPYVKEFPFVLECKVVNITEIGTHTQFIGEILDIKVEEDSLGTSGAPDIHKINPIIFSLSDHHYYSMDSKNLLGESFSIGMEMKK